MGKEVLYLRWNERHLRTYFETLMTLLQILRFLLQAVFLCETDLVIKMCYFMTATTNAENLQQYKIRFFLIAEKILAIASLPNIIRKVKKLSPNFEQIA